MAALVEVEVAPRWLPSRVWAHGGVGLHTSSAHLLWRGAAVVLTHGLSLLLAVPEGSVVH